MMIFAEPLDIGRSLFVFGNLVGEIGGYFAEVVFYGGEDSLLVIVGVVSD